MIKGLQKTSLVDYPGKVAATIFTGGCNFRCGFCHNKDLAINPGKLPTLTEEYVLSFLRKRKNVLDGICITGGEPTLHKTLPEFIRKVKEIGLLVKLDSNGTDPEMIKYLLDENLIDYIAMDIKGPLERYSEFVNAPVDTEKIKKSIELIKSSGIPYEFRTTIVPNMHTKEIMLEIKNLIRGSEHYTIQQFKGNKNCIDPRYKDMKPFSLDILKGYKELIKDAVKKAEIKNG